MKLLQPDHEMMIAEQVLRENEVLFDKIAAALDCPRDDVPNALREVLRFLNLVANHRAGMLTPSHRVDLAWHEFILCTKAYREVCDKRFGRYIDHHPGGPQAVNRQQFQTTLRCYRQTYGAPDPRFWGASHDLDSACGACETV